MTFQINTLSMSTKDRNYDDFPRTGLRYLYHTAQNTVTAFKTDEIR
jgi:hypothetical protein